MLRIASVDWLSLWAKNGSDISNARVRWFAPATGLSDRCRLVQSVRCAVQLMRAAHSLCNQCKYWNMTSSVMSADSEALPRERKNRLSGHFGYLLIANYTFFIVHVHHALFIGSFDVYRKMCATCIGGRLSPLVWEEKSQNGGKIFHFLWIAVFELAAVYVLQPRANSVDVYMKLRFCSVADRLFPIFLFDTDSFGRRTKWIASGRGKADGKKRQRTSERIRGNNKDKEDCGCNILKFSSLYDDNWLE